MSRRIRIVLALLFVAGMFGYRYWRDHRPGPADMPAGCRFSTRCPFADEHCRAEEPPLADIAAGHKVACWKAPLEENAA